MTGLLVFVAWFAATPLVHADPFATLIKVNDSAITQYEIDQRARMLSIFGAKGDTEALATEQIIDDRLRMQLAQENGISLTEEEFANAMEEFAQRGGLSLQDLLTLLDGEDVAQESFEDFIRAGLSFRNLVGERFGRFGDLSETEFDSVLSFDPAIRASQDLRFAEIVIPFGQTGRRDARQEADRIARSIRNAADFAQAAREHSRASSAQNAGLRDWVSTEALDPKIVGQMLAAGIGGTTPPIELNGFYAIFQLKEYRPSQDAGAIVTNYVIADVPGPGALDIAENILKRVDRCDDLRAEVSQIGSGLYQDLSDEADARSPQAHRATLTLLDPNEALLLTPNDDAAQIIMVCARLRLTTDDERAQFRTAFSNARIESLAEAYLDDMRQNALIVRQDK